MTANAAQDMKSRLRADLLAAMKGGHADEARLMRALVAAIDNAEAPPLSSGERANGQHRFDDGSAEVERLLLGHAQVQAILITETEERARAATDMDQHGRPDRAEILRQEIAIIRRYLD